MRSQAKTADTREIAEQAEQDCRLQREGHAELHRLPADDAPLATTNCGRKDRKKSATFGLIALAKQSLGEQAAQRGFSVPRASLTLTPPRLRSACTPIHTRYSPPHTLSSVKATGDAAISALTPSAASSVGGSDSRAHSRGRRRRCARDRARSGSRQHHQVVRSRRRGDQHGRDQEGSELFGRQGHRRFLMAAPRIIRRQPAYAPSQSTCARCAVSPHTSSAQASPSMLTQLIPALGIGRCGASGGSPCARR